MANICDNYVEFSHRNEDLVKELLSIQSRFKETEEGQLPDGYQTTDPQYIFESYISEDEQDCDKLCFNFLTKWAPALNEMIFLSDKYGVPFSISWAELGCCVAGVADYSEENGLWRNEWDGYQDDMNEDEEYYSCEYHGVIYESKEEAIFAKLRGK